MLRSTSVLATDATLPGCQDRGDFFPEIRFAKWLLAALRSLSLELLEVFSVDHHPRCQHSAAFVLPQTSADPPWRSYYFEGSKYSQTFPSRRLLRERRNDTRLCRDTGAAYVSVIQLIYGVVLAEDPKIAGAQCEVRPRARV